MLRLATMHGRYLGIPTRSWSAFRRVLREHTTCISLGLIVLNNLIVLFAIAEASRDSYSWWKGGRSPVLERARLQFLLHVLIIII